jgi:MoaA/NifB/PqqE/SkfB family radical SAM enzyme
LREVLDEIKKIETVQTCYFEGGEPFLYYPLMIEGIKMARERGFKTGVVTNSYWATSVEDAELWLKPLVDLDVFDISISDDAFHYGDDDENPAKRALAALKGLDKPGATICIEKGNALLKGRAVEKLVEGQPKKHWEEFTKCPFEDLEDPNRVHVDVQGNVHLCQGLSLGNYWKTPLSELVKNYDANSHPISGPLIRGGPALLTKEYQVDHENQYVDACHLCYLTRLALIDEFPEYLTPRQVYGLEQ